MQGVHRLTGAVLACSARSMFAACAGCLCSRSHIARCPQLLKSAETCNGLYVATQIQHIPTVTSPAPWHSEARKASSPHFRRASMPSASTAITTSCTALLKKMLKHAQAPTALRSLSTTKKLKGRKVLPRGEKAGFPRAAAEERSTARSCSQDASRSPSPAGL